MKKALIGLLLIMAIIAAVNYYKNKKQPTGQPKQSMAETLPKTPKPEMPTSTPASIKTYTMAEVAAHGAEPDSEQCWTVIHGKVYDILDFATNSHPGGEIIFEACGKDATKLFETRPMGSGTPHSAAARKILEKYYIGDLKK